MSDGRTSPSAWCRDATCEAQPAVSRVLARIEEFVRIPRSNFENFQVLKYGVGERYAAHHDFGASQRRLASGPRILTFFLYLSDVDEGGETAFPRIFEEDGITPLAVRPRRGSALLWPSVRDGAMDQMDARTYHEARRVVRGTKFAANASDPHARLQDPAPLGVHSAYSTSSSNEDARARAVRPSACQRRVLAAAATSVWAKTTNERSGSGRSRGMARATKPPYRERRPRCAARAGGRARLPGELGDEPLREHAFQRLASIAPSASRNAP